MCFIPAIEFAEHKYKKILEDFFITIYDEKKFSSHGIDHHRRVWIYAKELVKIRNDSDPPEYPDLESKLIIACYLHDIGMAINTGENHGRYSMDLCIRFLSNNHLPEK